MGPLSLALALLSVACATAPLPAHATCPPAGYDRARLEALKATDWMIADDAVRNALARSMTACVASPDPSLRDVPYEALQHWMRAGLLSNDTILAIGDDLQARLAAPQGDGVERPFAALVLAEVARTDRVRPWMTRARRVSLLGASTTYLAQVRDYRGFDDREGWRHGIAHGGDLMSQLALNPAFGKAELMLIRDAVGAQIAAPGHFYIYGESERLAVPIVLMAQRNVFSEAEWTAWLVEVSTPGPLASWNDAFSRNSDIARWHNVKAFIQAIYLYAGLDDNADDDVLSPGARAALLSLP